MSPRHPPPQSQTTIRSLWLRNGAVWFALMVLLMSSFTIAYLPLGSIKTAAGPLIAVIKASLVAFLFMELVKVGPLMRLAALAGVVFLFILFGLTLTEIISRGI